MSKQPTKKSSPEPEMAIEESPSGAFPADDATSEVLAVPMSPTRLSNDVLVTFSDAELEGTLKALRAEVRQRENAREASRPRVGSTVRILKGRPKYVGKVGTAVIVRRSRCFVAVPEIATPAYVLVSDLELLER